MPPGRATGQLIIGGVGLARYLDPAKDAEKFAPMPTLGWERAYRSRRPRRQRPRGARLRRPRRTSRSSSAAGASSSGEVDAALQALHGVTGAAAAVKTTPAGTQVLVGYVVPDDADAFDHEAALARLREELPAALVPLLAARRRRCRPAPRARSTAPRCRGRCPGAEEGDDESDLERDRAAGSPSSGPSVLGARVASPRRGLLRARRRQPLGGPARVAAA